MSRNYFLLCGADGPKPVLLHLDPHSGAEAKHSFRWQAIMCPQTSKLAVCREDPNRFVFICEQTGREFVPVQGFYTEDAWSKFKSRYAH